MATLKKAGKNRKSKYFCDNVNFDSQEEIEFYLFLKDALRLGIISAFEYQPKEYQLLPKVTETILIPYKKKKGFKKVIKTIYQGHVYTVDFKFYVGKNFNKLGDRHKLRINTDGSVLVDVKGAYNRFGGDRIFPINQKLLYDKHKLHVMKLIPQKFFKDINAAPDVLRWMKNRKTRTMRKGFQGLQSLDDLVSKKQEQYQERNVGYLP